jgi:hypothetical protein
MHLTVDPVVRHEVVVGIAGARARPAADTQTDVSIALCHNIIRHSGVLLTVQGGGGRVVAGHVAGRPGRAPKFHLTPESLIKLIEP